MMRVTGTALTVAVLLVLTGCSSSPSAVTKPSPPADGGRYGTVAELKNAFVKAGGDCPSWNQTDVITSAAQSGECSNELTLSIYSSTQSRDVVVATVKSIGSEIGGSEQLVGANWVINGPGSSEVRSQMGGTVVTSQ